MDSDKLDKLYAAAEAKRQREKAANKSLGARFKKLSESYPILLEPIGHWFWRKCPWCGAHVRKEKYNAWDYYACDLCDYEFAIYKSLGMD